MELMFINNNWNNLLLSAAVILLVNAVSAVAKKRELLAGCLVDYTPFASDIRIRIARAGDSLCKNILS